MREELKKVGLTNEQIDRLLNYEPMILEYAFNEYKRWQGNNAFAYMLKTCQRADGEIKSFPTAVRNEADKQLQDAKAKGKVHTAECAYYISICKRLASGLHSAKPAKSIKPEIAPTKIPDAYWGKYAPPHLDDYDELL